MTTYVYETIPQKPGEQPRYFEVQQSMRDAPLTRDPKTGEPVRRVIVGGYGVLASGGKDAGESAGSGGCGGKPGCCG